MAVIAGLPLSVIRPGTFAFTPLNQRQYTLWCIKTRPSVVHFNVPTTAALRLPCTTTDISPHQTKKKHSTVVVDWGCRLQTQTAFTSDSSEKAKKMIGVGLDFIVATIKENSGPIQTGKMGVLITWNTLISPQRILMELASIRASIIMVLQFPTTMLTWFGSECRA